ncbi:MAG: SDR family NAD(P)-dependent oxidoreductase [Kangiellaceae bacterium]|jgi:short-subunit dehydrogenase|nr:SDR family NAD(P)-dependent oxidoreductase [Kangiellaceae bacterium]
MIDGANSQRPVAIITGAASGLGLDLARQLQTNYHLVLIDIDQCGLNKHFSTSNCCSLYGCDLASTEQRSDLIANLLATLSRVDLLINNAGITHRSLANHTELSVTKKVMEIDYFAPVHLSQGLMPLLTASRGKIVNIGSMAGWMPVMARSGYCAAKSALHQYFETLRSELVDKGVAILMVYPSFLDTPIETNALDGRGGKASHKRTMVGQMTSSEAMAQTIVKAINKNQQRLFPDTFTFFSSIIYKLFPALYLKLMGRKFASELDVEK